MPTIRPTATAVAAVAGLVMAACTSDAENATTTSVTAATTTPGADTPATSAPTTTDDTGAANSAPATATSPTSTPPTTRPTTTTTTAAPTTTSTTEPGREGFADAPADLVEVTLDVPRGVFRRAPGDLVVLRTNGDLEYHPNGLAPSASNRGEPIRLVDRPDPRPEPVEGPGPNVIDDVAGIVNASFVYGDCCEPISGNLYAADAPGSEVGPIAAGFVPNLSPSGTRLAAANGMQLSVFDLTTGEGDAVFLNQDPDEPFRSIADLAWIDDETLAAITYDGGDHLLWRYDASTLARSERPINLDPETDVTLGRFTGTTPDGLLSVSLSGRDGVTVRYLEPTRLTEIEDRRQTFPASVRRVETDDDGLGQIWVDGGRLFHLAPGTFEADPLLNGVLAAWFVES